MQQTGDVERPIRILVVEDDADTRTYLRDVLEQERLHVFEVSDGLEAISEARRLRPDLILLDLRLPGLSGTAVRQRLRADFRTRAIPIVILSADADVRRKVEHLIAGADDYVTKPFNIDELVGRILAALRRSQVLRDANPLSGLPGNAAILTELDSRIQSGIAFSVLHADLDDFKSYNDRYGFTRGDEAIAAVARVLEEAVERVGEDGDFVGHVGGDDFVVLSVADDLTPLAEEICRRFDVVAASLHDPEDARRGWYTATDRRGDTRDVPVITVSVGIARSNARPDQSASQLAHLASEMKEVAKRERGSTWAIDRRTR